MKKIKPELSDYCISFNRRSQRNELNIKQIWLNGVRQQTNLPWNEWKSRREAHEKLMFIS